MQPNNMHGPKGAVCRRVGTPGASSYPVLIGHGPHLQLESLRGNQSLESGMPHLPRGSLHDMVNRSLCMISLK